MIETMRNTKKYVLYHDIKYFLSDIAEALETHKGAEQYAVYGIARGGLIPAVILSHMLDAPMCPLNLKGEPNPFANVPFSFLDNYVPIITDDIIDTGETIESVLQFLFLARPNLKKCIVSAPFSTERGIARLCSISNVSIYTSDRGRLPNDHPWLVFPWEEERV
jgi:hypoxanthine phosphoribosyltransferase